MKKVVILLAATLVGTSALAAETLIDFNVLGSKEGADKTKIELGTIPVTKDKQAEPLSVSLDIVQWDVTLNTSARHPVSLRDSKVQAVKVKGPAAGDDADKTKATFPTADDMVMGVRVFFPTEPVNSWAIIKPAFEIPAYQRLDPKDENSPLTKFDKVDDKTPWSLGIIKNVGVIKELKVNVRGLNFPETLSIILKDQNDVETEYLMGSLQFQGWRTLTWKNPNYQVDIRDRNLRAFPLYPNAVPYVKFVGFKVYKDGMVPGGDFITYFDKVDLVFDKATLEDSNSEIDDEATWNILRDRETKRREAEDIRLKEQAAQNAYENARLAPSDKPADAGTTAAPAAGN